jgi:demethylspheroidene O-methyltransferase
LRRNRILGSATFQRWAARLPLAQIIARRRAAAQFDLLAGFVYSQILAAMVTSGALEALAKTPQSLAGLGAATGLSETALCRLLAAAAALDLTEEPQPGLWTLGEAGAALARNAGVLAMVRHHHLLYADLADPLALLAKDRREETQLSAFWTYAARSPDAAGSVQDYSALMAATQPMVADQILAAYDFGQHQRLLDIGGGTAAFARAVAATAPALSIGVFDLPDVVAAAQQAAPGAADINWHSGNFTRDALPGGHDLITLVRIAHDHDDSAVADLFARIHAALPTGGRLLIVEPMAGPGIEGRVGAAYFGLYLWAMGSGRARTGDEYCAMLKVAGFARVRRVPTALPMVASALVAIK